MFKISVARGQAVENFFFLQNSFLSFPGFLCAYTAGDKKWTKFGCTALSVIKEIDFKKMVGKLFMINKKDKKSQIYSH